MINNVVQSTDSVLYTYYVRDAQGNILSTYEFVGNTSGYEYRWSAAYLYGSSRLGALHSNISFDDIYAIPNNPIFVNDSLQLSLGRKRYEISNHLGNVMATISDRKQAVDLDSSVEADYYEPVVLSATDYYPFGMDMPGRTYQTGAYRFGFNSKERDQNGEWGELNHYDYGFRIYNPGIGRFLSVDPLTREYAMLTPYQFAANRPIVAIDLDGLEPYDVPTDGGEIVKSSVSNDKVPLVTAARIENSKFKEGQKRTKIEYDSEKVEPDDIFGPVKSAEHQQYHHGSDNVFKDRPIPHNGIALGIEQKIIELNNLGHKITKGNRYTQLANHNNATVKEIYEKAAEIWLNHNIPNWQTLFKLP